MKPRSFSRWKMCPGFSGDGASVLLSLLSWNHRIVWDKRELNDPFLLLSLISPALFKHRAEPALLPFLFWKAIPQPHPSLSRLFLALFQSFPCSAEAGSHPARPGWGTAVTFHTPSSLSLGICCGLRGTGAFFQCCCGKAAPS